MPRLKMLSASAFEFSAIGMALVSLEGKLIKVNRQFCKIVGYSEQELLNLDSQAITHPHDLARDLALMQQIVRSEIKTYKIEKRYLHKNGEIVWVNLSVSIVKDDQGAPLYFVSQFENITEEKKSITEQKSAKEKFTKAFDLSPDLMVILREKDLVFVEANKKLEEISGFKREEVIGFNAIQKDFEIWPKPEERASFLKEYQARESAFFEAQLRRKNGEIFHGSISAQRIILGGENHMIAIVRDITERKENQEKLMISQANLNATINNTEIHIWSVDRNFNLLTFNKPFAQYIWRTYDIELRLGTRIFGHLNTPAAIEMTRKWSRHYLRALTGEIVSLEESNLGGECFQYSLSPIIEEDNVIGVSIIAENVTERKSRDRELAEANKKIGELKLMALRSVMNPHFIFNVLSSIQFFIAKNDKLNAINYLSTFSKLIRSILTHSVNNTIKLADEIAMLKNYVQLEMTRFENKFDFILNIDSGIDIDASEIPSLLIQPYVENAILHGLYNKHGKGTLSISIQKKDAALIFEIEDDGIGREAAMKIKQQNSLSHKSMGIKLTEERLRLINQQYHASFSIDDLMKDNIPCGTKVKICVTL